MATQPDHRREEAAAIALLLLGRRYNLPAMVRQSKTKPRPFRRIATTAGMTATMGAPYFTLVRAWQAERERLLDAYDQARTLSDPALINRAVAAASARLDPTVAALQPQTFTALASLDRWHRAQWIQRIRTATGIKVDMMTGQGDTASAIDQAKGWAAQLMPSLHTETGSKVAVALMGALAVLKPRAGASADLNAVLARAHKRAANIAVDQSDRTAAAMDRDRRAAAGLDRFVWRHDNTQRHPRPEHVARDGRRYSQANAPNDRAGTLPFCRCWEEPLFD